MRVILNALRDIIGPTAVIAAGTMGAGAVASFLLAGAWFRYDLLWVVLCMLPVFVISVDSASRIGTLNPQRGMFALIKWKLHPALAWLLLLINAPVHLLVVMGQISVMSSSLATVAGLPEPQAAGSGDAGLIVDVILSLLIAVAILWLVFSQGYDRMQRVMTAMMVLMFFCFLIVAFRGFTEWRDILAGFIPSIPPDLPVPGSDTPRMATSSIIAMVGSAIAPAALLGMPYLSADAGSDAAHLRDSFRRAVVNLGVIFGAYALFVIVSGGFALYPLPDNAGLEDVGQASQVLHGIFPGALSFLGPVIFSLGLFMAALTTMVVAAQVTTYFILDTVGREWRFSRDNRVYHIIVVVLVLGGALLAPHWSFPALLKVVLLMGINVVVIPLVYVIVIYLVNSRDVMAEHRASWWRNAILATGLLLSLLLAVDKVPHYLSLLTS